MPIKHYRIKPGSGVHFEKHPTTGQETEYKVGDLVPSPHNLHEKFESKFEVGVDLAPTATPVAAPAAPATPDPVAAAAAADAARAKKELDDAKASPLGEDVSADFPKVKGGGFTVYREGKDFFVSEDGGKSALNREPLKKAAVEDFVTDYVKA